MPIPNPKPRESQEAFISRCMRILENDYTDESQRAAICYRSWKEHLKKMVSNLFGIHNDNDL